MLNKRTIILLSSLFISMSSIGQMVVKTNLLHPVFAGGLSVAVEKKTLEGSTTSLYFSYGNKKDFLEILDNYKFYNVVLEQRFYLSARKAVPLGFFVAPYTKYMYRNYYREGVDGIFFGRNDKKLEGHSLGAGISVGIQHVIYKKLLVDVFAGSGYCGYIQQNTDDQDPKMGHADLRCGLSVGYLY